MRTPRPCCAHSPCSGREESHTRGCHSEGRPRTRPARRRAVRRRPFPLRPESPTNSPGESGTEASPLVGGVHTNGRLSFLTFDNSLAGAGLYKDCRTCSQKVACAHGFLLPGPLVPLFNEPSAYTAYQNPAQARRVRRAAGVTRRGREQPLRASAARLGCQATTESIMDAPSASGDGRPPRSTPGRPPAPSGRLSRWPLSIRDTS